MENLYVLLYSNKNWFSKFLFQLWKQEIIVCIQISETNCFVSADWPVISLFSLFTIHDYFSIHDMKSIILQIVSALSINIIAADINNLKRIFSICFIFMKCHYFRCFS